jgi:hypothetical protein
VRQTNCLATHAAGGQIWRPRSSTATSPLARTTRPAHPGSKPQTPALNPALLLLSHNPCFPPHLHTPYSAFHRTFTHPTLLSTTPSHTSLCFPLLLSRRTLQSPPSLLLLLSLIFQPPSPLSTSLLPHNAPHPSFLTLLTLSLLTPQLPTSHLPPAQLPTLHSFATTSDPTILTPLSRRISSALSPCQFATGPLNLAPISEELASGTQE